ncbi:MAG: DUF167 domain-containing protein [Chloroflexi bacterium]|nr:DUF167 domain-containing protein [Chloroflexota bacterium]MCL5075634.1 DUF167 domain-containing protein [Chloroflexota bacterium]
MAKLKIRLQPNSSRNSIERFEQGILKVKVTAPPIEGRANEALIELLAKALCLSQPDIVILHGARGRDKLINVPILSEEQLLERLKPSQRSEYKTVQKHEQE